MIKVLHLISGGDTGGAKTHIFTLMKGLSGRVDTKIICFIKDTFYAEAREEGIDIEVYPQEKRSDLSVVSKLSDEINNGNYDLVHAHGARANFIAMFLKKKINVPMVTTIHSDYMLDFKDSFYKNLIYTTLNKRALKKFDHYICVSDNFKKMLVDRGFDRDKIHVLYNGIETDEEIDYIPKEVFLEKYKINYNGELLVGIAARLDKALSVYHSQRTKPIIIVSGGQGPDEPISEALAMKRYLIAHNVPENHIFMENQSTNTRTNFLYSKSIIHSMMPTSSQMLCVTSQFHILRALKFAKKAHLSFDGIGSRTPYHFLAQSMIIDFLGLMYQYKTILTIYFAMLFWLAILQTI